MPPARCKRRGQRGRCAEEQRQLSKLQKQMERWDRPAGPIQLNDLDESEQQQDRGGAHKELPAACIRRIAHVVPVADTESLQWWALWDSNPKPAD